MNRRNHPKACCGRRMVREDDKWVCKKCHAWVTAQVVALAVP